MRSFRDQRLANDHEELMRLEQGLNSTGRVKLQVQPVGSRPYQAYNLYFHCKGYSDETGALRERHHLFLEFPRSYPMESPPTFKRVSPLFHPNIYPHGMFCLGFEGDRRWRPGISLESLILHVSRLIRFDPDWINLDPPANRTAGFWQDFVRRIQMPADDQPFVLGEAREDPPPQEPRRDVTPRQQPATRRAIRIESGTRPEPQTEPAINPGTRQPGPIRIKRNR